MKKQFKETCGENLNKDVAKIEKIDQNTRRMKSYFPYNDRLNRSQRSKVIYNLKLVAGTVTNFTLAEQNKDSMTEKQNLSRPSLKVTIHPPLQVMPVKTTGNNIKWYHFDILASGKTDFHCKIKETLFIQERSLPLMPRSVVRSCCFIYHLLTESEVITGKSQTEALMY